MNQARTEAHPSSSDEVLNSQIQYWYDLLFWGVRRGEDEILMLARIEIDQKEIPGELGVEIRREWEKQWTDDDEEAARSALLSSAIRHYEQGTWEMNNERSLGNQQQQVRVDYNARLDRDLNRLLVDKEQKMRIHLSHLEGLMIQLLRDGKMKTSRLYYERLGKLWSNLRKEEKASGAVSAPLRDDISSVPNQRRQSIEAINAAAIAVSDSKINA